MGTKLKRLIHGAWLTAIALIIFAKCYAANDLNDTLWSDPMELWIAVGVAVLLIERASDVLGGRSHGQ